MCVNASHFAQWWSKKFILVFNLEWRLKVVFNLDFEESARILPSRQKGKDILFTDYLFIITINTTEKFSKPTWQRNPTASRGLGVRVH